MSGASIDGLDFYDVIVIQIIPQSNLSHHANQSNLISVGQSVGCFVHSFFMKLVVYIIVVVRRAKYVSVFNLLKKETNWSIIWIRQRNSKSGANFYV